MKKVLLLFLILIFTLSCAVKQEMSLSLEGGGKLVLDVELDDVFVTYLFDIAEATTEVENPEDLRIFNIQEIAAALEKQPGVKINSLKSPSQQALHLEMEVAGLNALSSSLGDQRVFTITEEKGQKKFRFHLNKKGYGDVKKLFPFLESPVFDNLAPQVDEVVTKEEYLEILEFAMEKEGVEEALKSVLEVEITTPGKIISQKGGTLKGDKLHVKIPLLKALLLNDPIVFEVVYK